MTNLFRKVRQNLLSGSKMNRYIKYAFGEIVLVVIGILIALSINNWNETMQLNNQEKKILNLLNEDFQENSLRIASTIEREKFMLDNSMALIRVMQSNQHNIDSDSITFMIAVGARSWWRAEYVTGTYDAVVGSGNLNLLKNDSLKRILAQFSAEVKSGFEDHEESISYLIEFNKQTAKYEPYILLDYQYKDFGLIKNEKANIESINAIINNKAYLGLLINKTELEEYRLDYQFKIQGYITEILRILEIELKKMNEN